MKSLKLELPHPIPNKVPAYITSKIVNGQRVVMYNYWYFDDIDRQKLCIKDLLRDLRL